MPAGRTSKTTKPAAPKAIPQEVPASASVPGSAPSDRPAIRLLIADGHPLFLDGLEAYCKGQRDVTIVARCGDGDEALREIRVQRPDIALLDGELPTLDALAIVRRLEKEQLPTKPIIFIGDEDDDVMIQAVGSGVRGFLHKSIPDRKSVV